MKGTRGRSASGPNQPRGIKSRLPFWRMGYQAFGLFYNLAIGNETRGRRGSVIFSGRMCKISQN